MKSLTVLTVTVVSMTLCFSGNALAAQSCIKPAPPPVQDKSTMDAATRNAVTAQIDAYIAATNAYLACLEQSDAAARAEAQRVIQGWEAPVTDIEVVTD